MAAEFLCDNERVLTVAEVAQAESVSVPTVREWIKAGLLRAEKVWKSYQVEPEALEEFRRNRASAPTTAEGYDTPELCGLTANGRWLIVRAGKRWARKLTCKYCLTESRSPSRFRVRREEIKRKHKTGTRVEVLKIECGLCWAKIFRGGRDHVSPAVWEKAPRMVLKPDKGSLKGDHYNKIYPLVLELAEQA